MLNSKKTIVIILASLAVLVVGVFGYRRYAEFCQPPLQSDAYLRDQIDRGIVVRATNPAIIRELDAGLKEYKKKRNWGEWWQETTFSGCSKIFPPQQIILPGAPFMPTITPPQLPPQTQAPADTRSWGERFRDKTIPEVPGVTWQTYTNNEYGFEMEYPVGWGIQETNLSVSQNTNLKPNLKFYIEPYKWHAEVLYLSLSKGTIRDLFFRKDTYWTDRINKGLTPDASVGATSAYIYFSERYDPQIDLNILFEKDNFTYDFSQSMGARSYGNDKIIEHMIKTFHFLK